ncbi:hypothetical protein AU493_08515 [Lonsdalea populi]|nr:hypothetical protein AU493_08515 [Lonsdalea populi]
MLSIIRTALNQTGGQSRTRLGLFIVKNGSRLTVLAGGSGGEVDKGAVKVALVEPRRSITG